MAEAARQTPSLAADYGADSIKVLKGLEADECYYIQHEAQVRGRDELDLKHVPAPDLVIEVDISHHPMDRLAIYAALGKPHRGPGFLQSMAHPPALPLDPPL